MLASGGYAGIQQGGSIQASGQHDGVFLGGAGTVRNDGYVSAYDAVVVGAGASTITNSASGVIKASNDGVVFNAAGTFRNYGTLTTANLAVYVNGGAPVGRVYRQPGLRHPRLERAGRGHRGDTQQRRPDPRPSLWRLSGRGRDGDQLRIYLRPQRRLCRAAGRRPRSPIRRAASSMAPWPASRWPTAARSSTTVRSRPTHSPMASC